MMVLKVVGPRGRASGWPSFAAALAVILIVFGGSSVATGADESSTLREIADAYKARQSQVRSAYVEFDVRSENVLEMRILQKADIIQYLLDQTTTYAFRPGQNYLREISHSGPEGTISDRTQVWMEGKVYERRPNAGVGISDPNADVPMYVIQQPSSDVWPRFPCQYFSAACFDYPDPTRQPPQPGLRTDRHPWEMVSLPWVTANLNPIVRPETEKVDGAPCVVVEVRGFQVFWLDPAKGFVPRRREIYEGGKPAYTVELKDLTQASEGVWVPRNVTMTVLATAKVAKDLIGKPAVKYVLRMKRMELNNPKRDVLFEVKVPAGALVVDTTVKPVDDKGVEIPLDGSSPNTITGISYRQPISEKELAQVVAEAKEETGSSLLNRGASPMKTILILLSVCFILGIAGIALWRRSQASTQPPR